MPFNLTLARGVFCLLISLSALAGCLNETGSGATNGTLAKPSSADAGSNLGETSNGFASVPISAAASAQCDTSACDPRLTSEPMCVGAICRISASASTCDVVTTPPTATSGPCDSTADCAQGFACFGEIKTSANSAGWKGECKPVCCATGMACDGGKVCVQGYLDGEPTANSASGPSWGYCESFSACSVLNPHLGCPGVTVCKIVDVNKSTACVYDGNGADAAACSGIASCSADVSSSAFVCAGVPDAFCKRLCSIGATSGVDACPTGENCIDQTYTPSGIGICVKP